MTLSTSIFVWIGAVLTFFVLSFLYKDNPFYKFAEHLVVGATIGYSMIFWWKQGIYPKFVVPLFQEQHFIYIIPAILGLLMVARIFPKISWVSRFSMAFVMGAGAGLSLPRTMQATILKQLYATMFYLNFTTLQGFWNFLILIGVISVLIYFYFSKEHKGVFGGIANIGIWYMMIGFGATFGYTVMARISLLIGRVQFLLHDWLGIIK